MAHAHSKETHPYSHAKYVHTHVLLTIGYVCVCFTFGGQLCGTAHRGSAVGLVFEAASASLSVLAGADAAVDALDRRLATAIGFKAPHPPALPALSSVYTSAADGAALWDRANQRRRQAAAAYNQSTPVQVCVRALIETDCEL